MNAAIRRKCGRLGFWLEMEGRAPPRDEDSRPALLYQWSKNTGAIAASAALTCRPQLLMAAQAPIVFFGGVIALVLRSVVPWPRLRPPHEATVRPQVVRPRQRPATAHMRLRPEELG